MKQRRRVGAHGYKGVSYVKKRKKWQARLYYDSDYKHIGLYATPEEAARAWNEAARRKFGDGAVLNSVGDSEAR